MTSPQRKRHNRMIQNAARTIRRITFAFLNFGISATKTTSRGASAFPKSRIGNRFHQAKLSVTISSSRG